MEVSEDSLSPRPTAPRRRKGRRIRCSMFSLIMSGVGATLVTVLCVVLATDHGRIQFERLQDALHLKRVTYENRQLAELNVSLQAQVEELQDRASKAEQYEDNLKKQLESLALIVRTATSLGLVDGGRLGKVERESRSSVGGAEIDCDSSKEECRKLISPTSLSGEVRKGEGNSALLEKMKLYIDILRTLPIGVPAHGEIASHYGFRVSPFGGGIRMHEGLDVDLNVGDLIYSTADGEVVEVGRDGTYGLMIDIKHSSKVITRYAHLSRTMVKRGERVSRGEVIGLAGTTGRSTGPHLHYEVRVNGVAKDPMRFLKLAKGLERFLS